MSVLGSGFYGESVKVGARRDTPSPDRCLDGEQPVLITASILEVIRCAALPSDHLSTRDAQEDSMPAQIRI
jgi:hypothetical protein